MKKISAAVCLLFTFAAMTGTLSGQTEIRSAVPINLSTVGYPDEAIRTGLDGRVSVNVTVNKKGRVTKVNSVSGPGFVCPEVTRPDVVAMRKAASEAAMRAVFEPGTEGGKAVESTITINYDFAKPVSATKDEDKTRKVGTTKPLTVKADLLNGKATKLPKPKYPAAAAALGKNGEVSVKVLIETDGTVFSAEPISGDLFLQNSSVTAACKSEFGPTLLSGKPVRVVGTLLYNFVRY